MSDSTSKPEPQDAPAWLADLSPYPDPADEPRLVHRSLSDVPWDVKANEPQ